MSVRIYMCVYCDTKVTNGTYCVPCNEYKGVVPKAEWEQFNRDNPKTKNKLYKIEQGVKLAGENLLAAYQSGEPELMQAVLINTLSALPSYLDALQDSNA